MANISHLQAELKRHLAAGGLSAAAASLKAGLGKGAITDILSGKSDDPGIRTLSRIAAALGVSIADLLRDGPVPERGAGPGGRSLLLIIGGGIAAYKSLDLIRRLKERGGRVRVIMTKAAGEFVTALSASALSGERVFTGLFDRDDEHDVGHIRLAREADAIVVAPATADLMARMAHGRADDLATAVLLATRAPVLLAPAMNPAMWAHHATQRNVATLRADGMRFIGPNAGEMAERGEAGLGRMAEPLEIVAAVEAIFGGGTLAGRHVIVTSGPTHEPLDPVRYLANRSSGRQGHAIAAAAARAGARVTLVSGPVAISDPPGVQVVHVETAEQMLAAVNAALPADVAIFAAAVADWRAAKFQGEKIKKKGARPPQLALTENPDILSSVAHRGRGRPRLVIGFAAETQDLMANATRKLQAKGADWIVANDVSPEAGVMGGEENTVHIISAKGTEDWPRLAKVDVAERLVAKIAAALT
ncbi:MAG TPA: bifunctional phosphopantothenoylcysteine decarboxylase/phosphopantothenate--cysteine ligase CoaBC [Bauldia sp.]|nr:bifunctional phosphopantothenoylcysteine decarboxylase/phosphopantothenate--cysteine ligase CoaBC [Bauldia sp.]